MHKFWQALNKTRLRFSWMLQTTRSMIMMMNNMRQCRHNENLWASLHNISSSCHVSRFCIFSVSRYKPEPDGKCKLMQKFQWSEADSWIISSDPSDMAWSSNVNCLLNWVAVVRGSGEILALLEHKRDSYLAWHLTSWKWHREGSETQRHCN